MVNVCRRMRRRADGHEVKAWLNYKTAPKEVILVKVGISGTSIAGAQEESESGDSWLEFRCGPR